MSFEGARARRDDGKPVLGRRVVRPREQVEDTLRASVLNGRLAAGERLPAEAELARQFSVSRPTIRQALSALETQGLIRKVPGARGGWFVRPPLPER
ncbi:GntR family transcriptional regulator [Amycolatopsis acidicola]|uniref:GntR family transcriptional regulator n=1 Tax=Amycolatopsis acidicola TaxID=2596893 RepID=A0A5N0VDR8_9PSEU|nr:GntR family transcriptional regulator [Amycolatopsis acidicola]KAA9163320.1 GntR family transcriptional regulator [Amycolatopsis acidicola]